MNSESTLPGEVPRPANPPGIDWRYWARRLLVCNPFFLCSAALLLFGVSRLSLDEKFLGEEVANLLFNVFALLGYETLVVVTAVILARRKVWYDSALLVVMENGLVLVPFLLLSHSIVITRTLAAGLAAVAVLLAVARFGAVRRWYPQFNLPGRALALGAAVLLLNAALPFTFWPWVEADMDRWILPNQLLWFTVLPALVFATHLLPRPMRFGGLNPERHWLPLFNHALWVAGTGVHVWCVGYVCKIDFQFAWLGPVALAAAWTMWRRIDHCVSAPGVRWEIPMLVLTFVAPFVSWSQPALFEILVMLNLGIYSALVLRREGVMRRVLRELIFSSPGLLVAGMPESLLHEILPAATRTHALVGALGFLVCLGAFRWPGVRTGILGACVAMLVTVFALPHAPSHLFVQVGAVFLLVQSLRWKGCDPLTGRVRAVTAAVWWASSAGWIHGAPAQVDLLLGGVALAMLGLCVAMRFVRGTWPGVIVPVSSACVALTVPADRVVQFGSAGITAMAASLVLFGVGTAVACTRHRWERTHGLASTPGGAGGGG
jgi:hypothetical protein